ncbi:VanW family protein [Clostridium sp.]|uniref:VanW family protein n=1 Tax=Clostridium sp. TaxID=1506 RepID=UPI002FCC3D85
MKIQYRITRTSKILIAQFIFNCIGLLLGLIWQLSIETKEWNHQLYSNINVENHNLGGKTKDEARKLLKTEYIDQITNKRLHVTFKDRDFSIELSKLINDSNLDTVINNAFDFGKDLSILEKYQIISTKYEKRYKVAFTYDEDNLSEFVKAIQDEINKEPVNAKIVTNVDGTLKKNLDGSLFIEPAVKGYKLSNDKLLQSIRNLSINNLDEDVYIDASIEEVDASITETMLVDSNKSFASFSTTFYSSTKGRSTNIALCARTINGILLMPGDVFSFNDIVGDTTIEKGYLDAPVIVNNKVESGVGGGICQVSSTLYNAILRTGINSLERSNHTFPSSYVGIGLDATISWDYTDYKFKNTLNYPLFIECYPKDEVLYVNIYSNEKLKEKTYIIENDIYEVIKPKTEYVYNKNLKEGETHLFKNGSNGYKVKVVRKTLEKDVIVNSEIISNDTYTPIPTVYSTGSKR